MAINIDFKGIIRTSSGQEPGSGAMEELINLRRDSNCLRVVAKKKTLFANTNLDKIFEHTGPYYENIIAAIENKVVWINSMDGTIKQGIHTCSSNNIYIESINNMLIICCQDDDSLVVYVFREDSYSLMFSGLPNAIIPQIIFDDTSWEFNPSGTIIINSRLSNSNTEDNIKSALMSFLQRARTMNPEFTEGYILVSTNYTLFDGSETKMSPPTKVSIRHTGSSDTPFSVLGGEDDKTVTTNILVNKFEVSITMPSNIGDYSDIIRSVNVYISNVIPIYDTDPGSIVLSITNGIVDISASKIRLLPLNNDLFENQLFYRVQSFLISGDRIVTTQIDFSDITTGKTMDIDSSGWINTVGVPMTYNARLHLYDYKRIFRSQSDMFQGWNYRPPTLLPLDTAVFEVYVYLRTNTGVEDIIIRGEFLGGLDRVAQGSYELRTSGIISFPDSRAYKVVIIGRYNNVDYNNTIELVPSHSYNYAFATEPWYGFGLSPTSIPTPIERTTPYTESDVLIASALGVPFHFPVEHSYRINGNIRALSIMAAMVSDSQIGQYPLVVFTSRGIYALEQGGGLVLYSNIIAISNDICESNNTIRTKYGVVYIANNSVNILIGRHGKVLSSELEAAPDKSIRDNINYPLCLNNATLIQIFPQLSEVDFRDYIISSILLYDSNREEIIVSNGLYAYSYVYSLRTQFWHKISSSYRGGGMKFALQNKITTTEDVTDLVYLTEEDRENPVLSLVQTQPINLGKYGYKTISRLILRGELFLQENTIYGVYIFASNDLTNWKCVAARQININIANIRTERAKLSYRYFVIIAAGEVNPESNIYTAGIEANEKLENKIR